MATFTADSTAIGMESPGSLGLDSGKLDQIEQLMKSHISDGHYPGGQFAIARNGKLARVTTLGDTTIGDSPVPAVDSTLWLLFSQTKVVVTSAIWKLVDQGVLRFADQISDHVQEFSRNGKGEITVFELLTHQGGFPGATVPSEAWADHDLLRRAVCDFSLEWTPGSRVNYHGTAAHWVAMVLIEAITGRDYRDYVREEILEPIGLSDQIFVGVPEDAQARCSDIHAFEDGAMVSTERNTHEWRAAGVPGAGGYATAHGMAAFYQMILAGGVLNGTRILSPRVIQFATRNHTGDRVDHGMGMPMHRGIGPHVRGYTPTIRGLGTIGSPSTFGHGGAGTSYSWGDPESGVSFTYISNCMAPEPWHTIRLDKISNLAHASIIEM
ncbi:MAG: serine hydrolase domain-containing protein [SAR202 cluster bacterium]|nr:serine hydrolase domain-containing protein [SAR202 cluster bacterium]